MRSWFAILLLLIITISCTKSGQFVIKGTVTNSLSHTIYLDKLEVNGITPYDSAKITKNGTFKLNGMISQPTFFLLRLTDQNFITLLLDSNEQVTFSADFINFSSDYNIEGSLGSMKVKELNHHLLRTNTTIDSIQSLIKLHKQNNNYLGNHEEWLRQIDRVCKEQQVYSRNFILENPFSLTSILAIYQKFNNGEYIVQDLQTIKIAASALYSMYPTSEHAKALYNDTKSMIATTQNMKLQEFINSNGSNSPEIELPDPSGREIKLSSLRGKFVLIQFWSALDLNSRILNPVLKENYQKFNSRGFEIYQVSVDTSRQTWIQTIKADGLNWLNVGDMNGSQKAVASYNIQSVPFNYLLDREGKIIARDLKGPALYKKLNEILN
jgi:peroxiredoxin